MTEKLKTLLHDRAETVDFDVPDLDALVRAGDRRIRRRGLVGLTSVAAVAVVGALAAGSLTGDGSGPGRGQTPVANDPGTHAAIAWTTGSVLHEGGTTRDLGHPVDAFVRTAAGYVFASKGDVYETTPTGVQRIGEIDLRHPHLVSDPGGTLAGWVQRGTREYVVHDLATDVTSVERVAPQTDDTSMSQFVAIDGSTAYWHEDDGIAAHDLATGRSTALDPGGSVQNWLIDVRDGVLALYGDDGVRVGRSYDASRPLGEVMPSSGVLSPDATYYAPDDETLSVLDVASGRDVTPALDGYFFSTGYEWLSRDTIAVIALERSEDDPLTLLTCTISTGDCTVAVDAAGSYPHVQLPVGDPLGG
ncbi:MAG: hypothetical protein JWO76_3053 [Nocardioides sp.]|nr:hypothetical protein [Nocardioides sp.]